MDVSDEELFPDHAWDEAETIFTDEDDEGIAEFDQPDEDAVGVAAEAGLNALIRTAAEGDDG